MLTCDVDLLILEPALFKLWRIDHQQRCRGGNGTLDGTSFSASGVDFVASGVQVGDVLYLASIDSVIDGCYEIIEVVSTTQLTVSMVRGDETDLPIAVGSGNNLIWRISTFAPQRARAERSLSDRLELTPEAIDMLSAESRRQFRAAVTAAALVLIFEALIQQDDDDDVFERKKDVYQQATEAAVCRLRLELDTTGDGRTDTARRGDEMHLKRG